MQALSDEQGIDALEKKIDAGFAKVDHGFAEMRSEIKSSERGLRTEILSARSEARADFRTLLAVVVSLWATTVLAVIGVLAAHL
jgi:hypothetical protein